MIECCYVTVLPTGIPVVLQGPCSSYVVVVGCWCGIENTVGLLPTKKR